MWPIQYPGKEDKRSNHKWMDTIIVWVTVALSGW